MFRKPLVMGNWKMHGSRQKVQKLIDDLKLDAGIFRHVEVVVIPSFVHLQLAREAMMHRFHRLPMGLGAQNLDTHMEGAYTGEISGLMLADMGCQYVLAGHSERRHVFGESNELVAEKFRAAIQAGLHPVLCVGETQAERESHLTEVIIERQLAAVLKKAGSDAFQSGVIAYEPVWAIGTGLTATPDQAQAVHAFIRSWLKSQQVEGADRIRILYGGSVKPENAMALFDMPEIDGGLIGGASLDAQAFSKICELILHKSQHNVH